ncbi:MAG: hypothetical protein JWN04_2686 [Myxococcaceae bacterium]|nr:hypothetical protein [Myxococcaceae bacterium]
MDPIDGSSAQAFVSVCLLAYNHARTLADALRSILAQDHAHFELIVSDDCSTDDSWAVIQRFAAADSRVRPIRTPRNLGMAANANFAVAHSSAPYIAILHHDDVCAPSLLRRWLEVAERHPSVAFVGNAYGYDDASVDYHPFEECTKGTLALEEALLPNWGCPIRGTALVRRSCWDAVGGIRERFGMLADVDLWMRLAARWDIGYVRDPLIIVRHECPENYPEGYHGWSWSRFRLLYDIHGTNRLEYYQDRASSHRHAEMMKFRLRVTLDELRWLAYAVLKRRRDILQTSHLVSNHYELGLARFARETLARLA